ncbi:MAG: hypothetical protein WB985_19360 [Candidatus Acidiferrales bacterium]
MRYMMIMYPRDYAKAKPGFVPDNEAIQRMSKYNEELAKARVLVTLDGLTPCWSRSMVSRRPRR